MRPSVLPLLVALAALAWVATPVALAQCDAERAAVNTLIDRYAQTESDMDMRAQAQLMADDRVWIGGGAGRMTNQAMNMDVQQADYDAMRAFMPGVRQFVDARDREIRFYGGDCNVAVASFYWYIAPVVTGDVPPERLAMLQSMGGPPRPSTVTLVLEKRGNDWRIVHTHASPLSPPSNG